MDASYDGSFGSFSAGGKDPGGEVFDGVKNDANSEIKLEQSAGDLNNTDLAVDHSKAAEKAINIEPVDNTTADAKAAEIVLTDNKPSDVNVVEPDDTVNSSDTVGSVDVANSDGPVLANDETVSITPANNMMNNEIANNPVVDSGMMVNSPAVNGNINNAGMVGSGTVSGSSMMSGGVDSVNMVNSGIANRDAMSNANRNNPIVSVSAGGIDLPNAAEAKKSKRGLIIGVVVVAILALVGAIVGISFVGKGGGGQVVATKPLKEAFNSYINYVWYGKDSDEDFDINTLDEVSPYFLNVKSDGVEVDSYVIKANEKYEAFETVYHKDNFGSEEISALSDYYQDYVALPKINTEDIVKEYVSNGYEAAVSYIDKTYSVSDNNLSVITYNYLLSLDRGARIILDIAVQARSQGCVNDNQIDYACFALPDVLRNKLDAAILESSDMESMLASTASLTLDNIYREIYVDNSGVNAND